MCIRHLSLIINHRFRKIVKYAVCIFLCGKKTHFGFNRRIGNDKLMDLHTNIILIILWLQVTGINCYKSTI